MTEPGGDRQPVPYLGHGVWEPVNLHAQLGMPEQSLAVECSRQWVAPGAGAWGPKPPAPDRPGRWLHGLGVWGVVQGRPRIPREVAWPHSSVSPGTSVLMWHGVGLPGEAVGAPREHRLPVGVCLSVSSTLTSATSRSGPAISWEISKVIQSCCILKRWGWIIIRLSANTKLY